MLFGPVKGYPRPKNVSSPAKEAGGLKPASKAHLQDMNGETKMNPELQVVGQEVDYWSEYNKCWLPAVVERVEIDSGRIFLDVKPGSGIPLKDQCQKIRPRTMPTKEQVAAVSTMQQDGRVHIVAENFFKAVAKPTSVITDMEVIHRLGNTLDSFMGLSGCQTHLVKASRSKEGLTLDKFKEAFWDLVQLQHEISVQAIPRFSSKSCKDGEPWTRYECDSVLGKGTFGKVHLAICKQTKQRRAIKTISAKKVRDFSVLEKEMQILSQLDHPHILKLHEVYSTSEELFLVTDHCEGGELKSRIEHAGKYGGGGPGGQIPEGWIADVMLQLLLAVAHIHERGILHLDLKSANLMLMPSLRTKHFFADAHDAPKADFKEKPHLMVIDLGVAMNFMPGNFRGNKPMGTPQTMAPEVWHGIVTPCADIFSCGCIFFELLSCGQMAFAIRFDGSYDSMKRFWNMQPAPQMKKVEHANLESKQLLKKMLQHGWQDRPTAVECSSERFLAGARARAGKETSSDKAHLIKVVKRVATTHHRSILYKNIALSIVQDWPPNKMPTFKQLFDEFDILGTGMLPVTRLADCLKAYGIEQSEATLAAQAVNLSNDNSGINFTQFVAACIDLSRPEFEKKILMIFDGVDGDKDGLLSAADLARIFPQSHKYAFETGANVFMELTGRDSKQGAARLDWNTFKAHLHRCARSGMPEEVPSEKESANSAGNSTAGQWGILANVLDAFNNGPNLFSSARSNTPAGPHGEHLDNREHALKALAAMGFSDREINEEVIREKGWLVTDALIDAIVAKQAHS
eukprot:TRINITY_DN31573_c0_g1_i1.p1 TRINITY_DN31573_c0_g1~~TRINITY_DN31573_c0_g1_i1.p1  ORF type:complete len:799 (-),score=169.57 TRINITY_DN31573_c0_g1_i1:163-2559(-)